MFGKRSSVAISTAGAQGHRVCNSRRRHKGHGGWLGHDGIVRSRWGRGLLFCALGFLLAEERLKGVSAG